MQALYINPFTDFGFKRLFGENASKPMLIDFLNSILPENSPIVSLSYKDKERLGRTKDDRTAIYDIYCENEKGEKFIIELQKAEQQYFKDRTIYYSTFPIQDQAIRGPWNYKLKAVYCIGILDFEFNDYHNDPSKGEVIHTVQLKDQHNRPFYDKLKYVYVEMPNFNKKETELVTRLDKWLYFIKNLEDFENIPNVFKDDIFIQAFEKAEISKYNRQELYSYEKSLKIFRDNLATFDFAKNAAYSEGRAEGKAEGKAEGRAEGIAEGKAEGKAEGIAKGKAEIVLSAKKMGLSIDAISQLTGLPKEDIEKM